MKRILPIIFVLILLAASATACGAQPRTIVFDGVAYQTQNTSVSGETYRALDSSLIQVDRRPEAATVFVGDQIYRVSGSAAEVRVTFPDGRELTRQYSGDSSAGLAAPGVEASEEDWERVDELREIVYSPEAAAQGRQSGWRWLLAALFIALGLFQLLQPRLAWQISEGWRYRNVEPSESYLTVSRVGGAVMIVVGLVIAFGPFG